MRRSRRASRPRGRARLRGLATGRDETAYNSSRHRCIPQLSWIATPRCARNAVLSVVALEVDVMAVRAPRRSHVLVAVALLSMAVALLAAAPAQSQMPDRVSLTKSTIRWSTVKYATDAQNG